MMQQQIPRAALALVQILIWLCIALGSQWSSARTDVVDAYAANILSLLFLTLFSRRSSVPIPPTFLYYILYFLLA